MIRGGFDNFFARKMTDFQIEMLKNPAFSSVMSDSQWRPNFSRDTPQFLMEQCF